jgi:DNA processing protein
LWREISRAGVIVSETPPGCPAQAWRFPSRNRVIAGLAKMVVVVECHASGGSWHTVEAALRRGLEVGAVPGSVRSAASVGTNTLLHEGATPIRGAHDVLGALGAGGASGALAQVRPDRRWSGEGGPIRATAPAPPAHAARDPTSALDQKVLAAVGWRGLCLEEIMERSGLPSVVVVAALDRLEQQGAVTGGAGWWSRSVPRGACDVSI